MAALTLSACGAGPDESDESTGPESSPAEVVSEAAEEAAQEAPETAPETAAKDVTGGTIPDRFHGTWDYVGGTCAPESDLRIEVSAREITFYESTGKVVTALPVGDTVIVDLEMSGEGEVWTQKSSLINKPGTDALTFQSDATNLSDDPTNERKRCS